MAEVHPFSYGLLNHACRICGGRLLQSSTEVRCAECGVTAPHSEGKKTYRSLCFCGEKIGLRCKNNPNQTPESPQEVIVEYVEPAAPKKPRSKPTRNLPSSSSGSSGMEFIQELDDDGLFQ